VLRLRYPKEQIGRVWNGCGSPFQCVKVLLVLSRFHYFSFDIVCLAGFSFGTGNS
jgi:hypothetical protein